jgi:hypothetical protein
LKNLYLDRKKIYDAKGKKEYNYSELFTGVTYHRVSEKGNMICANPWSHARILPSGDTTPCSWAEFLPSQNLNNYLKDGEINWKSYFNNSYRKLLRYKFKHTSVNMTVEEFKNLYSGKI